MSSRSQIKRERENQARLRVQQDFAYRNALNRERRAYAQLAHGRSRRTRAAYGRAAENVENLRRGMNENQMRAVHDDIIEVHAEVQDQPEPAAPRSRSGQDNSVRVIEPQNAPPRVASRVQNVQSSMVAANEGRNVVMNLRPFDPELGGYQTRTVVVKVNGYYEVIHGDRVVVSDRNHSKEHVFEIRNFTSYEELHEAVGMAFEKFEKMIATLDGDSGYKAFYPMVYIANDSYSPMELAEFVRTPTTIRLHANLPVQYGFLKRLGVDIDSMKQKDYDHKVNCFSSVVLNHLRKHKIMVRMKWTELKMAQCMLQNNSLTEDQLRKRGLSIEDAEFFFDKHQMFNVYSFDQYGNILWKSQYNKQKSQDKKGGQMKFPPLLFVSHDSHCYEITCRRTITSLLQRIRAMGNGQSNMFQSDKEAAKDKKIQTVVDLLDRPRFLFEWPDERKDIDLTKLDSYEDCNLFVDKKDLRSMLIQLYKQQNYVHVGESGRGSINRIHYHNDVTIWANPNKSVVNMDLKLHGSSAMSREVCRRFQIPFKNQSIGAATGEFCDKYFNPLSGKNGDRKSMSAADRLRHLKRFDYMCQGCHMKIKEHDFEVDHIIRREVGGSDEDSNLEVSRRKDTPRN